MQISPLVPQTGAPIAKASGSTRYEERTHTFESQTDIRRSGDSFNLNLSISSSSTYVESMYTDMGTFDSPLPQGSVDIVSGSGDDSVPAQSSHMLEDAMNKYMEMISGQIERLLTRIAELQQENLERAGVTEHDTSPVAGTGSILQGYSVYSQEALTATLEISGNSGYYSPEKTAERIVNFALSFYDGGDRQEYAAMVRKAVTKGFQQAMGAFGGSLPQVSYDTIGLVNAAIDTFAAGADVNMSV